MGITVAGTGCIIDSCIVESSSSPGIDVLGDRTIISNCTLSNTGINIDVDSIASDVQITSCTCTGGGAPVLGSINLNGDRTTVSECNIHSAISCGIEVQSTASDCLISGCIAIDCAEGYRIHGPGTVVTNCKGNSNSASGIRGLITATYCNVSNCSFRDNTDDGLTWNGARGVFSSIICRDNTDDGIRLVEDADFCVFTGLQLNGNGSNGMEIDSGCLDTIVCCANMQNNSGMNFDDNSASTVTSAIIS